MRSYERAAIFFRASRPLLAISTSYPSSPRMSAMAAATSGSSSTTRMQAGRRASIVDNCSAGIRMSLPRKGEASARPFCNDRRTSHLPRRASVWFPKIVSHGHSRHPTGPYHASPELPRNSLGGQRVHVHGRLLRRHPEVILADDVVAVEHAPGDVPRDGHGHSLGDTRSDHVPGRGAAQVVEQLVGDPGNPAGGRPGPAEISHG